MICPGVDLFGFLVYFDFWLDTFVFFVIVLVVFIVVVFILLALL